MTTFRKSVALLMLSTLLPITLVVFYLETSAASALDLGGSTVIANIPVVESLHPYEPNSDAEWTIDNHTGLNAMRLYLSRVELEDGVDRIEVYDEDDVLVQIISDSALNGLWTDVVPGSLIKIKLVTDSNVQKWGLEAIRVEGVQYTTVARSAHPYSHNLDDTKFLLNDTANPAGTRVHFDRIELENLVDYIVIMDSEGQPYQWITGSHRDFTSMAVPGPAIQVRLISDSSINGWGYNIDSVQSASPGTPDTPPVFGNVLAETPHPIGGDYSKSWTIINPDPGALNSKIHFSQLSLAKYDSLKILDADDKVIQRFGEGRWENIWSLNVPGRVVKISYFKSRWYDRWGFAVDGITTADEPVSLAETSHPIGGDYSESWTIVNPNPHAINSKIYFSQLSLAKYDSLKILDADDKVIQRFGEGSWEDMWSEYVPGRIVKISYFKSRWYSRWGFRVDDIVAVDLPEILAESPHPYPSDIDETWIITNPDIRATHTKILFERMDIAGYDRLDILDSNDTVMQSFHKGTHLRNFWSDYVPGRTVKVRLRESDHYEDWGFRVTGLHSKNESLETDAAYMGSLYLALTQPGTVTVNGSVVIQATSSGEYKLLLTEVGEYEIKIDRPGEPELLKAVRKADGSLQVLTSDSPGATVPVAVGLTLPHPGIVYVEDTEFADAVSAGEYKIDLQALVALPDGRFDVRITYHEQIQSLEVVIGATVHRVFLPSALSQ